MSDKMRSLLRPGEEMGKALVRDAKEKLKQEMSDSVIESTKAIITLRERALEWKERNHRVAKWCDIRLKALESGAFILKNDWGQVSLIFNDPDLNITQEAAQERAW